MSTTVLETPSGSVIELKRFSETSRTSVGTLSTADANTRVLETIEEGSVQEAEQSTGCSGREPCSWDQTQPETVAATQVDEELVTEDEEPRQRNVSQLAPTDEGFHAWAFVSGS